MSQVIPHKVWRNSSGATVGIATSHVPAGYELVIDGWTVKHPDGTTGLGRKPFETEAEAKEWCRANPNFKGMGQH